MLSPHSPVKHIKVRILNRRDICGELKEDTAKRTHVLSWFPTLEESWAMAARLPSSIAANTSATLNFANSGLGTSRCTTAI